MSVKHQIAQVRKRSKKRIRKWRQALAERIGKERKRRRDRIEEIQDSRKVKDGVDVSEHNGSIDWKAVAGDAGFAFIKATEGRTFTDRSLTKRRVREATDALGSAYVGYYHFARPDNNSAEAEARHFVDAVRDVGGRIGRNGVLDYETARPGGGDAAWIGDFVSEYRELTGERPIIYGGSVLRERTNSTFGCPLWLAAYTSSPYPYLPPAWAGSKGPRLRIWQFTDRGSCRGIAGNVDRNRFYGDRGELRRLLT